jgi:hypothetical protein
MDFNETGFQLCGLECIGCGLGSVVNWNEPLVSITGRVDLVLLYESRTKHFCQLSYSYSVSTSGWTFSTLH